MSNPLDLQILATRQGEQGLEASVALLPPERYFEGHFPGRPILPGVAEVVFLEKALRAVLARRVAILEILRMRFLGPVEPGSSLTVELRLEPPDGDGGRAGFTLKNDGTRVCEGRLRYGPGPEDRA